MTPLASVAILAAKRGVTGQQKFSAAVVAVIILGWLVYIGYALSRRDPAEPVGSEVELAPNRKAYFDDDVLETTRLDRSLIFALAMLVVVAIGLPLYWLNEPSRQKGAVVGFNNNAAKRGASLFDSSTAPTDPTHPLHFGCADCHGQKGVGGVAPFFVSDPAHPEIPPHKVTWSAPPLNSVTLRYDASSVNTDPNANLGTALDAVRTILVYGRPGSPMPAWGLAGGGPMNDQQINDLVAYIQSIQLSNADATKYWLDAATQKAKAEGKPFFDGQVLFEVNCARCHTKGYSYGEPQVPGGGGQYAPNITGGVEIRQFPDIKDQIDFVTNGVGFGKGYGTGGIGQTAGGGMPHFGNYLSQAEITLIVQYERGL